MIKVCQVVSDTNIGGAGRYLLNYLKYYDRERYKVSVVLPEKSKLLEFVTAYQEVNVYEIPHMADKSYDGKCVKILSKLFKKEKFDILHTHASLSARIAGRIANIKTIISTRHCIEPCGRTVTSKIKGVLNNILCDYYIGVSDAVSENLLNCGIKKNKIKTVYNGVEPIRVIDAQSLGKIQEQYGINESPVFGIFARLEKVKGHRYFIEAAKEYLSKGNKGTFLIVGDGTLADELKEMTKDTPQIKFCGYVKDTAELLNVTDVNVISSESEAMSLAILEAMSLGKPTIATNVGGNPQLIRTDENGIMTEYKDVVGMCAAFEKMASNGELYNKCSENAKKEFDECFTAQKMVERLQGIYQEVSYERK